MAALNSFAHGIRQKCHSFPNPETLANPQDCVLGVEKPQIDFMLIGDSHANSYTGLLDVWAKDAGLRGYDSTQDTTIYLPGVQRGRGEHEVAAFQARNDAIEAHLKQHHYQFVVMSAAFSQYLDAGHDLHPSAEEDSQVANHLDSYFAGLQAAVDSALASSEYVVMLMDVPVIDPDQANCSLRREWLEIERECAVSADEFQQSNAPIYQWMSELQQQYPQLIVVEPTKVLCDAQQCDLSVEGTPLYRNQDDDHLSFKGSEALGQAYLQQYGNPLKSL